MVVLRSNPLLFHCQQVDDADKDKEEGGSMNDLAELVHTIHTILQNENILSDSMKVKIIKYFR